MARHAAVSRSTHNQTTRRPRDGERAATFPHSFPEAFFNTARAIAPTPRGGMFLSTNLNPVTEVGCYLEFLPYCPYYFTLTVRA